LSIFAEVDAFGTPVPSSVAIPAIPQVRFFVAIQYVSHRFAKLEHPGNILSNFGDFFASRALMSDKILNDSEDFLCFFYASRRSRHLD